MATSIILRSDPLSRIHPFHLTDHFDHLPDSLLLLIFNKIGDVKSLGRLSIVSQRFKSLIPQVENVVVRVDCVISDDDPSSIPPDIIKRSPFSTVLRLLLKPLQILGSILSTSSAKRSSSLGASGGGAGAGSSLLINGGGEIEQGGVTHHSPTQVLKNFDEIRFLRIELPSGELGIDDGVLLKWKAEFGSTLENCVILGASSVISPQNSRDLNTTDLIVDTSSTEDNGSIPESFYTDGGLKLRVVWTISSLIAASARHYLLQPIVAEHKTVDNLVLNDVDGQGVLCMNREQLEELRVKPLSASSASKRTLVPALNMRLWYAPSLELPDGTVLKGATLVAIRPSEEKKKKEKEKEEGCDLSWVSNAFDESSFGVAAKMLVKRRTYCLEMNSF